MYIGEKHKHQMEVKFDPFFALLVPNKLGKGQRALEKGVCAGANSANKLGKVPRTANP